MKICYNKKKYKNKEEKNDTSRITKNNYRKSQVLGVGVSTIYKLIKRFQQTGKIEASYPGRQPKITPEQISDMEKLVIKQPDITIDEIIQTLNLPIKKSQVSNILRKLGFRFKKKAEICKRTKTY